VLGRAFEVIAILVALGAGGGLALRLWRGRGEASPGQEAESDPTYPALAAGLGLLVVACCLEAWLDPPSAVTPAMWAGRGLVLGAALLTLWGRRVMGPSYAPTAHHPRPEEQRIVHEGPYRFLAHPQYVGNFGSLAGLVLALDLRWSWLALLPFAAALAWRIRREEAWLRAKHGADWRAN
jgi:protein-S-isoprenylcysteine O-methyltransferase Ste14